MKKGFRYVRPDTMSEDDYFEFESAHDNRRFVAQDAAKDYHSKHDGWESAWLITIRVMDDSGLLLGVFEVERVAVLEFYARAKSRRQQPLNPSQAKF